MKVLMFVIVFLLIGAFFIVSNQNLQLNSKENMNEFVKLYGFWLDELFFNGKGVVGHVVKMEWLPDGGNIIKDDLDDKSSKSIQMISK